MGHVDLMLYNCRVDEAAVHARPHRTDCDNDPCPPCWGSGHC